MSPRRYRDPDELYDSMVSGDRPDLARRLLGRDIRPTSIERQKQEGSSMPVDFKPSQIRIFGHFPPFLDTFDASEAEIAAALVVRALTRRGDTWRVIELLEVGQVLREDITADKPDEVQNLVKAMIGNPFCRPVYSELVVRRFAVFEGTEAISFTPAGIERLRKWVAVKP